MSIIKGLGGSAPSGTKDLLLVEGAAISYKEEVMMIAQFGDEYRTIAAALHSQTQHKHKADEVQS
jgi:hypothetical protein